jgi:hypothetical protein
LVEAVVRHDDGPVESKRVEVPTMRHEAALEICPAGGADPRRIRLGPGVVNESERQLVHRARGMRVGPARLERGDGEVMVRVDETWAQDASVEVLQDGIGVPSEESALTDCHDAIARNDNDLGARGR